MALPDRAYLLAWLAAFAATQLIEVPIYLWRCVPRRPWVAVGASGWTHPMLWFVAVPVWRAHAVQWAPQFGLEDLNQAEFAFVVTCEVAIVLGEGLWLRGWRATRPWTWALVANATSFAVGELIYWVTM